jgi:crotonobetainyl-CoA:carnitine CoA-transferase CaiB-like acyl-CoA transferase
VLQDAIRYWSSDYLLEKFQEMEIPAAPIRNMQEVFELPQAREMVLEGTLPDGNKSLGVKTVAFTIS